MKYSNTLQKKSKTWQGVGIKAKIESKFKHAYTCAYGENGYEVIVRVWDDPEQEKGNHRIWEVNFCNMKRKISMYLYYMFDAEDMKFIGAMLNNANNGTEFAKNIFETYK
ncbi:MAG: hypothetical protein JXR78_15705 [Victivallales bacterium]|nr:hypothetical protein [Victivallales bacterium]